MMERKRMTPTGISSYEFHEESAKFVFGASSFLYQCMDHQTVREVIVKVSRYTGYCKKFLVVYFVSFFCVQEYPLTPVEIRTPRSYGARLNAEISPTNSNLIAYVNNGDLWVVNSSNGKHYCCYYNNKFYYQ